MEYWGITAFESDAGLDAVGYIRSILPEDGKLELGEIIKALQANKVRLPNVENAEKHTSPMALAEIVTKYLDGESEELDNDMEWEDGESRFSAVTSFSASKEDLQWLRNYVSDTLQNKNKNAAFSDEYGEKWGGWFEEKNWIGWQEHMASLIGRLDALLVSPEDHIELLSAQEQEKEPTDCFVGEHDIRAIELDENKKDLPTMLPDNVVLLDIRDSRRAHKPQATNAGIQLKAGKEADYNSFVEMNSQDGYSFTVLRYMGRWGKMMEEAIAQGDTVAAAAERTRAEADTDSITLHMYSYAVYGLSEFWQYGDELRAWHNQKYEVDDPGVANPAMLVVEQDDDSDEAPESDLGSPIY